MPPKKKAPAKATTKKVTVGAANRELIYRPTLTGWTPNAVLAAESQADAGNLTQLADLVETIMRDDRVSGVLSTRTQLLGLPVDFTGGDAAAREILSAGIDGEDGNPGEFYNMLPEHELLKLLSWGIMAGVGLAQLVPLPRVIDNPQRYRLETWSPRWLSYDAYRSTGTKWRLQTQEGMKNIVPGDGQWVVFTPYGENRPWGMAAWSRVAFPWLLKHFSLEDRANYSEALGNPITVGTVGVGSTEKQRRQFLSQLRGLGKAGKIVLPNGWDLALKEASGKSYEIYEGQVSWADSAIAIALAGQVVTTEGTSGFSSGNIFETIAQNIVRLDGKRLDACIHDQVLQPWAHKNYGSRKAAPWARYRTKKPVNIEESAKGYSALGDAISKINAALAPYGKQIDIEKMVAEFNLPVINVENNKQGI